MTATPAITSSRPVCPIDIPTGNTTKKDKFDRLFRMLFNAGEPISMDAEETLAGLHNNGNWDAVWYTEASPYLIRVVVYKKDDDGNPGIEVSLSKKKPGEGLQFTNFTRRELDLLSQYKIGVFDHNSQKASPLISLNRDAESPSFEIPLSTCNQELDHSITLPAHREPDRQITPYSFSIFVTKTGK